MWTEMAYNRYFSTSRADSNKSKLIEYYLYDEYMKYTIENQSIYEREINEYSDDDYEERLLNCGE